LNNCPRRPEGQEGFGIAAAADGAYTRRSDAVRTAVR
jgi:hypothetical protein